MIPLNIDCLPVEYCLDRGFHFLISIREDWDPNTIVPPELLDIYTDASKFDNGVRSGVYSRKTDLNISLQLPDYCSVFQAEVMAIYWADQWILVSSSLFTRVLVLP